MRPRALTRRGMQLSNLGIGQRLGPGHRHHIEGSEFRRISPKSITDISQDRDPSFETHRDQPSIRYLAYFIRYQVDCIILKSTNARR